MAKKKTPKAVEPLEEYNPYVRYHAHANYLVDSMWDEENDEYCPLVVRIEGCAHSGLFKRGQINMYVGSIYASFKEDEFVEYSFADYFCQVLTHEYLHLIPEIVEFGEDAHHWAIHTIEEILEDG